ncbi:hypothetical protein Hte_007630 [Hypoxylon texense]
MEAHSGGDVLPTQVPLVPTNHDKFPLSTHRIRRSALETLFTFNSYDVDQLSQLHNHPDLETEDVTGTPNTEVDGSKCKFAEPRSLLPALENNPLPDSSPTTQSTEDIQGVREEVQRQDEDEGRHQDEVKGHGSMDMGVLFFTGHPPYVKALSDQDRTFTVPTHYGMDRPSKAFENLCFAAVKEGKLDDIRSADFVTDTETLWCLFSTVYDYASESKTPDSEASKSESGKKKASKSKASKHIYTKAYAKKKGLCVAGQVVNGTIFMKALNTNAIDEEDVKAATAHLRDHGLQWCWSVKGESGGPHILNSFKRVVKYKFGDMTLVVEDSSQVLSTAHDCSEIQDEDFVERDNWE